MSPVIYRLEHPLKKVMVYRTGKLMFWGAKSINDMEMAFMIMRKEMQAYEMTAKPQCFDPNEQETSGGAVQWGL
jgi:TATA-box binding protein (TBP) (component of TFIID and TFIIIB)